MNYHRGSWITAKYSGRCAQCQAAIMRGDTILHQPAHRRTICRACADGKLPEHMRRHPLPRNAPSPA